MSACDTMPGGPAEDLQRKEKNEESIPAKNNATDSEAEDKRLEIIVSEERAEQQSSKEQLTGQKREASTSSVDSETKTKKIRNKPKPLVIENMREYVDNNTLEKLTTATLRHWLRQQSIHCTTRDKKADLVEKVCKHFVAS